MALGGFSSPPTGQGTVGHAGTPPWICQVLIQSITKYTVGVIVSSVDHGSFTIGGAPTTFVAVGQNMRAIVDTNKIMSQTVPVADAKCRLFQLGVQQRPVECAGESGNPTYFIIYFSC